MSGQTTENRELPQTKTGSAPPAVGVIYNPRSHRNRGRDLQIAERSNVHFAQPDGCEEIARALGDFARCGIDFLIINGGDGTVRDVLTCGEVIFGDDWPVLAVLPKGKTNALNVDLGAPAGYNLADAIAAFPGGNRVYRRPLVVEPVEDDGEGVAGRMLGFILGAGGFTLGVRAGQDAHRMGAFDSLAVGVTSFWGVLQALFGRDSNKWRRGVKLDIFLGAGRKELAHSGGGYDGRRALLLSSTLERFPVGLKIFGKHREGLKLTTMDRPHRRLLVLMPLLLAGYMSDWMSRMGMRQQPVDSFEFSIDAEFILDGEAFPAGRYHVTTGPELTFVVP